MDPRIGMLSVLAGIASMSGMAGPSHYPHKKRSQLQQPKRIFPIIPKGMKRFEINGHVIHALNEKNAQRKASKLQPI